MLITALNTESDSVFVDILTYSDLEELRKRKLGNTEESSSAAPGTSASRGNSKRYLILTYAGEFDRAHYPLPLAHDPDPSPAALRRTVERLRAELAVSKDGSDNGGSASGSGGSSSRGGQLQVMPARPGRLAELEVENRKLSAALGEAKAKLVAASAEAECAGKVEAQIGDMAQAYERLRADYEGLRNGEKLKSMFPPFSFPAKPLYSLFR